MLVGVAAPAGANPVNHIWNDGSASYPTLPIDAWTFDTGAIVNGGNTLYCQRMYLDVGLTSNGSGDASGDLKTEVGVCAIRNNTTHAWSAGVFTRVDPAAAAGEYNISMGVDAVLKYRVYDGVTGTYGAFTALGSCTSSALGSSINPYACITTTLAALPSPTSRYYYQVEADFTANPIYSYACVVGGQQGVCTNHDQAIVTLDTRNVHG